MGTIFCPTKDNGALPLDSQGPCDAHALSGGGAALAILRAVDLHPQTHSAMHARQPKEPASASVALALLCLEGDVCRRGRPLTPMLDRVSQRRACTFIPPAPVRPVHESRRSADRGLHVKSAAPFQRAPQRASFGTCRARALGDWAWILQHSPAPTAQPHPFRATLPRVRGPLPASPPPASPLFRCSHAPGALPSAGGRGDQPDR